MAKEKHGLPHIHIKHPGALHKELGIKSGHHIPLGELKKAANSKDEKLAKRAQFALNARKWHHK